MTSEEIIKNKKDSGMKSEKRGVFPEHSHFKKIATSQLISAVKGLSAF